MKARLTMLVSLATIAALLASSVPDAAAQDSGGVPMSLSEAMTRALENNLDLAVFKLDPQIAEYNVTFQKAEFDPILGASLTHAASRDQSSNVNVFYPSPPFQSTFSTRSVNDFIDGSLRQKLNFGATYAVTANYSTSPPNAFDITDAANAVLYNDSFGRPKSWWYSLQFRLPLLQGLGRDVNEAPITIAQHNATISDRELQRRAELTVQGVVNAYWDLLATRKAQEVAEQALKLSQDLFELNKKKVEVGTLAPIEITQAEANVASNVEGTIRTKQAVKNAEDNLRRLLAVPENDPLWSTTILPTEQPLTEQTAIDQDAALKTAMERRVEIANAREDIEIAKLNELVAKDGKKHQLDLIANWRRSHAETSETIQYFPPAAPATYGFDPVSRTSPDWSLVLSYTYPIGNRAAKSNYAASQLSLQRSQTILESTMQDVRVDVRTSARAVETGYERVVAARKNVELQQKKLDAEQKKFDNGMSTSFEVFTFQTDLRNSQLSLIQAVLDYNKGLSDLERAKGTLLESKNLKLDTEAGR